ncbi:MAG: hypothetical protein ACR5K7_06295 [Symbiopectobacterium sp.]
MYINGSNDQAWRLVYQQLAIYASGLGKKTLTLFERDSSLQLSAILPSGMAVRFNGAAPNGNMACAFFDGDNAAVSSSAFMPLILFYLYESASRA